MAETSQSKRLAQARQLFYQSVNDRQSIKPAIILFNEIFKNKEMEGLALTYIGALTALKGKFAFFPIQKYRHVIKGLDLMDQGVMKNPDNIEARFVRGMTCYYLPFFFNRKETAIHDFKSIVRLLEQNYRYHDPQVIMNVIDFLLKNAALNKQETEIVKKIQSVLTGNEN